MAYFLVLIALVTGIVARLPEPSNSELEYTLIGEAETSIYASIEQGRTDDGAFILGDSDAPVTIVTFQDFLCPHCQNYQPVLQEFIREHVVNGDARLEFRMLPVIDEQLSVLVFQLVECADTLRPNTFWEAHDVMYEIVTESRFRLSRAEDFAERMNLDYDELMDCTDNAEQVYADLEVFRDNSDTVFGTPSVGYREGDGELRFDAFPIIPSADELDDFIDENPDF
jgi:thiol-disulfide isomerase/thioredoxin